MNAGTGEDSTNYFYSFPSNRIELWFLLESERFLHPVFREFYKERDVVREERRMRVESSPQGKLVEALLATAFEAHPYRVDAGRMGQRHRKFPASGSRDVLQDLLHAGQHHHRHRGRRESRGGAEAGREIFRAIAHAVRCRRWCAPSSRSRKAKSAWRSNRPRSRSWRSPTSVPISYSKDDAALDVLSDVLSGGRTGIIYKELVRDKKIALAAGSAADTFPAENIRRCSCFS